MKFEIVHHCADPNDPQGRTYGEINLLRAHEIPLGALVEILPYEDGDHTGVRLFVVGHDRDCDGAPLYSLSWQVGVDLTSVYSHVLCGFSDDNLRVISNGNTCDSA